MLIVGYLHVWIWLVNYSLWLFKYLFESIFVILIWVTKRIMPAYLIKKKKRKKSVIAACCIHLSYVLMKHNEERAGGYEAWHFSQQHLKAARLDTGSLESFQQSAKLVIHICQLTRTPSAVCARMSAVWNWARRYRQYLSFVLEDRRTVVICYWRAAEWRLRLDG